MSLKTLAELMEGDERQRPFGGPTELHRALAEIELGPGVPQNVRSLFDTARNLSLCTWFVYDFHSMADLAGYLALEAALKAKASKHGSELAQERSFRKLMDHALAAGWIAEERIAGRREIARMRVEDRKSREIISRMKEAGINTMSVEEPAEAEIFEEECDMRVIEGVCEAAVSLRNKLAHGETMLIPGSYHRLRLTADLINQIYA